MPVRRVLEGDGFYRLHHLEESGRCIGKVVHDTVFSVLAQGGFQYGHLLDEGLLRFGTVILDQFARDAERHTLEGAELGFGVVGNLPGGIGQAEGHDVDFVLKEHHSPIGAHAGLVAQKLWWLLLITVCVLCGFFFMFRSIVDRYSRRISSLPDKVSPLQTFPLRGWILIIFMTSLGLVLKQIPLIPAEFTASFYSGLGPMLLWAAYRFVRNGIKE